MSSRQSAITVPGIVLSQPLIATTASNRWASQTSSIESAITSRLTSEARIPGVPIVIPSDIAIVFSSIGVPPAARIPSFTFARERAQVEVAGHRLDPRVRDRDERLGERLVVVADALQIGPGGRAFRAVGEDPAAVLDVEVAAHRGREPYMPSIVGARVNRHKAAERGALADLGVRSARARRPTLRGVGDRQLHPD